MAGLRRGDRVRVAREGYPAGVLTTWSAPYTGGGDREVPVGTVLVVDADPVPGRPGFVCLPEDYRGMERPVRYGGRMPRTRSLSVRREVLAELTAAQAASIAGGSGQSCVGVCLTGLGCVTRELCRTIDGVCLSDHVC